LITRLPIVRSYMYDEHSNRRILRYKALPELCQELLAVVPAHPPIYNVCLAIELKVSLYLHRFHTYDIAQQRAIAAFLEG